MSKNEGKGSYIQLSLYVSDDNETLINQAGVGVPRFLNICVQDAVERARQNLGVE